MPTTTLHRTIPQLYRDCLRLVRHVAPGRTSAKSMALRRTVRVEFQKPLVDRNNEEEMERRKLAAVRALSNYMLTLSVTKDAKLSQSAKDYHGRSVQQAKEFQKKQQQQQPKHQ